MHRKVRAVRRTARCTASPSRGRSPNGSASPSWSSSSWTTRSTSSRRAWVSRWRCPRTTPTRYCAMPTQPSMYKAKVHGKARSELFDRTLRDSALDRARAESTLRTTLRTAFSNTHSPVGPGPALWVEHQPVLDLDSGAQIGTEALARLRDEQGVTIPPNDFIPVAEETGLIGNVERALAASHLPSRPGSRTTPRASASPAPSGVWPGTSRSTAWSRASRRRSSSMRSRPVSSVRGTCLAARCPKPRCVTSCHRSGLRSHSPDGPAPQHACSPPPSTHEHVPRAESLTWPHQQSRCCRSTRCTSLVSRSTTRRAPRSATSSSSDPMRGARPREPSPGRSRVTPPPPR